MLRARENADLMFQAQALLALQEATEMSADQPLCILQGITGELLTLYVLRFLQELKYNIEKSLLD